MAGENYSNFLDDEAVNGFKKLYLKEYGIELTNQQVAEYGGKLVRLVMAVYGNDLPKLDKKTTKE